MVDRSNRVGCRAAASRIAPKRPASRAACRGDPQYAALHAVEFPPCSQPCALDIVSSPCSEIAPAVARSASSARLACGALLRWFRRTSSVDDIAHQWTRQPPGGMRFMFPLHVLPIGTASAPARGSLPDSVAFRVANPLVAEALHVYRAALPRVYVHSATTMLACEHRAITRNLISNTPCLAYIKARAKRARC